jgi:transcriptional regulator
MYVPPRFKSQSVDHVAEIVSQNPLATLISVVDGVPLVSHLPLLLEGGLEKPVLIGHLARANPHSKVLASGPVTAIFHGPNTYITPSWYSINNVPTWNYAVIHMQGTVEMIEDQDGVENCVRRLSDVMEKTSKNPWEFWIPPNLSGEALTRAISGFRIRVETIESKFKLSQQHPESERQRVIDALKTDRIDEGSQGIAELMKKTKSIQRPTEEK